MVLLNIIKFQISWSNHDTYDKKVMCVNRKKILFYWLKSLQLEGFPNVNLEIL
jgi:hypothetical protein